MLRLPAPRWAFADFAVIPPMPRFAAIRIGFAQFPTHAQEWPSLGPGKPHPATQHAGYVATRFPSYNLLDVATPIPSYMLGLYYVGLSSKRILYVQTSKLIQFNILAGIRTPAKKNMFCLVSGKPRDPKKAKTKQKRSLFLGKTCGSGPGSIQGLALESSSTLRFSNASAKVPGSDEGTLVIVSRATWCHGPSSFLKKKL